MNERVKPKFLRRRWYSYGKLGLRRKKKQKWRNPNGRDNKMREKRRGYLAVVSIGYGADKKTKGKINDKTPVRVENMNELKKVSAHQIAIFGKVGKKLKLEMVKYAHDHKIHVQNVNLKNFLGKHEKKEVKETKSTTEHKHKSEEKK